MCHLLSIFKVTYITRRQCVFSVLCPLAYFTAQSCPLFSVLCFLSSVVCSCCSDSDGCQWITHRLRSESTFSCRPLLLCSFMSLPLPSFLLSVAAINSFIRFRISSVSALSPTASSSSHAQAHSPPRAYSSRVHGGGGHTHSSSNAQAHRRTRVLKKKETNTAMNESFAVVGRLDQGLVCELVDADTNRTCARVTCRLFCLCMCIAVFFFAACCDILCCVLCLVALYLCIVCCLVLFSSASTGSLDTPKDKTEESNHIHMVSSRTHTGG